MNKTDVFKLVLCHSKQLRSAANSHAWFFESSVHFRSIDKLNDFDQDPPTSGSSIKSQVLDLKTLPIFSPLKRGVMCFSYSISIVVSYN